MDFICTCWERPYLAMVRNPTRNSWIQMVPGTLPRCNHLFLVLLSAFPQYFSSRESHPNLAENWKEKGDQIAWLSFTSVFFPNVNCFQSGFMKMLRTEEESETKQTCTPWRHRRCGSGQLEVESFLVGAVMCPWARHWTSNCSRCCECMNVSKGWTCCKTLSAS